MTIEDNFDKEFGIHLHPQDGGFIKLVSKNQHVALVKIDLMKEKMQDSTDVWEDFIFKDSGRATGLVRFLNQYYSLNYIKKAIYVLNPNKYNFVHAKHKPSNKVHRLLVLKRDNDGIMIASANDRHVNIDDALDFEDVIKNPSFPS